MYYSVLIIRVFACVNLRRITTGGGGRSLCLVARPSTSVSTPSFTSSPR